MKDVRMRIAQNANRSMLAGLIFSVGMTFFGASCLRKQDNSKMRVTNGELAEGRDFRPEILQIVSYDEQNGSASACTATLISPRHIISAAHCVTEPIIENRGGKLITVGIETRIEPLSGQQMAARIIDPQRIYAVHLNKPQEEKIDLIAEIKSGRAIQSKSVIIPSGYVDVYRNPSVSSNFDLAIIELPDDKPISLQGYARIMDDAEQVTPNQRLVMYGYGCDDFKPEDTSMMGYQQMAPTVAVSVEGKTMSIGGSQSIARQCQGDSGGPTFFNPQESRSGQLTIVGIHSTKAARQDVTPEGYDEYLGFPGIRQFLREALPSDVFAGSGGGSMSYNNQPPRGGSNFRSPNNLQRERQNYPRDPGSTTGITAAYDPSTMTMFICTPTEVSNVQILAGDKRFYPARQNASPSIHSLKAASGWMNRSTVPVSIDGDTQNLWEVPLRPVSPGPRPCGN